MSAPTILHTRTLHAGKKYDYVELTVKSARSGDTHTRQMVRHPGAAVIVPILDDGRLLLIRNYRVTLKQYLIELPAGMLDDRETPEACAGRELIEETGYKAGTLKLLGSFAASPGYSDEILHVVSATGLAHVGQDLEDDEEIELSPVTVTQALQWVDQGHITDGKTLAGIFLAIRKGFLKA